MSDSTTAPGYTELSARIDALAPLIDEESNTAERERHMSTRLYEALIDSGLWHMLTPRDLGGSELPFSDALALAEQVAYVDGSTGWCLMVAGVQHGSCGSLITPAGCEQVFAAGTRTNIAGQGIPRGFARPVEGGYEIWGDWSYGSGIYHADWIHSGCVLMDDEAPVMDEHGHPVVLITYVPRAVIELLDNWDVMGLKGTGSFDYRITTPVFVAEELTYVYNKNTVERGGAQYGLGIVGFTSWGHTSFALGTARRALDELARIAREKAGPFGILADSASFQEKFAHAEARYRAARAFVYEAWRSIDESSAREQPHDIEQIALIKLAFKYSHEVMSDVCTFAYKGGGGVALRPSRLQRCYRDAHAGMQHVLLSDEIVQDCGKVLMGHAGPGSRFQLLGLEEPLSE